MSIRFPFTVFAIIIVVQLGVLSVQIFGGSRSPKDSPAVQSVLCAPGFETECTSEAYGEEARTKTTSRSDHAVYSLDAIVGGEDSALSLESEALVQRVIASAGSHHFDSRLLQLEPAGGLSRVASSDNLRIRPVPEPNSALTIGGGCVALVFFSRRRRVSL